MSEQVLYVNPHAAADQIGRISHKPAMHPASRSLRSITFHYGTKGQNISPRQHLYLSNKGTVVNGIHVLTLHAFDNRDNREIAVAVADPVSWFMAVGLTLNTPLVGTTARTIMAQLLMSLGAAVPEAMTKHLPAGINSPRRVLAACYPLIRHLGDTRPDLTLPVRIPGQLHRTTVLECPNVKDLVARLTRNDTPSRASIRHTGDLLLVNGRLRTRELSLLALARGLDSSRADQLVTALRPEHDGSLLIPTARTWPAATRLAQLSAVRHLRFAIDIAGRADAAEVINAIAGYTGDFTAAARCTTLDHLLEVIQRPGQQTAQSVARAAQPQRMPRGPMDDLHDLAVPELHARTVVVYPGQDKDLVWLGTQMGNCIRHMTRRGNMPFPEGQAIIAAIANRRPVVAVRVDANRRVIEEGARQGRLVTPNERRALIGALAPHGVTYPRRELPTLDDVPW